MSFDAFLKIPGIDGESQDDKHKGAIDVLSFSWGANQVAPQAGPAAGAAAGKVQLQDLHFIKRVDTATPQLFRSCVVGSHFPTAVLTVRKAGREQQEYLKVTMSDLLVSSFSSAGNAQTDGEPLEDVALNFSKIEVSYTPQSPSGNPI